MIDVKEFRLGNYVFYNGEIEFIHGLNYHEDVKLNLHADIFPIKGIYPIPLTPEWLELCGFIEKSNHNADGDEIEWYEHPKGILWREGIIYLFSDTEKLPHIQYVHQLQNFYRWVTGEELEIKQLVS